MKIFSFSYIFALLTTIFAMIVFADDDDGSTTVYDKLYKDALKRATLPPGITLEQGKQFPCSNIGSFCVSVFINSNSDYEKYSLDVLDETTANSNYGYIVNKGSYDIRLYSDQLYSINPFNVLMTCGKGGGSDVDHDLGWVIVELSQGYATFTAYQGALARFGDNSSSAQFTQKGTSQTDNQVNLFCPTTSNN